MIPTPPRRVVLGISGASGAIYALRLLEQLLLANYEVHLVVSEYGRRLLFDEHDIKELSLDSLLPHLADPTAPPLYPIRYAGGKRTATVALTTNPFAKPLPTPATPHDSRLFIHPNKDVGAVIASGSFLHEGMVILPASSTTLGAVATGSGSNLLCRAAMVTLKERRPLIVCHRETPLSLIDIENYRTLTLAGAILCPTNPGLYLLPATVEEMVDFIVGKVLDLLKVPHQLKIRWEDAGVQTLAR